MRRCIVATIVVALGLPATASAGLPLTRPIGGSPLTTALDLAAQHHGAMPSPPCDPALSGVFAATREEMGGAVGWAGVWHYQGRKACLMWLWPRTEDDRPAWMKAIKVCTTVAHEFGHLLQKKFGPQMDQIHSPDPNSVMYAQGRYSHPTYGCYRTFLPPGKDAEYRRRAGGLTFVGP